MHSPYNSYSFIMQIIYTKFKSGENAILYAARQNSILICGDLVHFYVNGKKIEELKGDKYFALHLKPGKSTVRWRVYSSEGNLLFDMEYDPVIFRTGAAYGTVVNHAFGA